VKTKVAKIRKKDKLERLVAQAGTQLKTVVQQNRIKTKQQNGDALKYKSDLSVVSIESCDPSTDGDRRIYKPAALHWVQRIRDSSWKTFCAAATLFRGLASCDLFSYITGSLKLAVKQTSTHCSVYQAGIFNEQSFTLVHFVRPHVVRPHTMYKCEKICSSRQMCSTDINNEIQFRRDKFVLNYSATRNDCVHHSRCKPLLKTHDDLFIMPPSPKLGH